MTDAVISTLDYGGDFSYMVNNVLDSSDASDCSIGLQHCSEIGEGCNENSETGGVETLLPSVNKARLGQRSKGRPLKPMGSSSNGGCRSVIQCSVCTKTFNNSSALAKHKLIHSDERKYACTLCSKAFKRQDHLNGHMMTHYSKKPYECKFIGCDKSYCDARSLRRHLENHHQQLIAESGSSTANSDSGTLTPASAPPEGTAAGMSVFKFDPPFLQPVPNSSHSESGSDGVGPVGMWPAGYDPFNEPKPVKCTMCDRRFRNLPALNGHMRLHGGYTKKESGDGKAEDSTIRTEQSSQMVSTPIDKLSSLNCSITSPLLLSNANYSKTDPDAEDCMLNRQSPNFTFSSIDNCSSVADQQLNSVSVQRSNLFDHSWLDDKQSGETAGTGNNDAVKLEMVEASGQASSSDCCNEIDFGAFSDEFFNSDISLVTNGLEDVATGNPTLGAVTGLSIGGMNRQQQMLVEDDMSQFSFGLERHMPGNLSADTASSNSYSSSSLKSPIVSNAPVMFGSRHPSFSDHGKSTTPGYSSTTSLQQAGCNTTVEIYSVQQRPQHTPVETHAMLSRYNSCFQFGSKPEQDAAFHYPSATSGEPDMFTSSHVMPENHDSFVAAGHPSTPKTPMFSAIGAKMQQMNLRTPRTPYSPSTPNRSNRFQFPSSSVTADSQPHGYQKPAGYHPYAPSIQQQPPSSPHFLNQRHLAMLTQHDRHRFRNDVAQAQHVIDQHLHQLHQKDILKHQQHSMLGNSLPAQSDPSVFDGTLGETKQSEDMFDLLFTNQHGNLSASLGTQSHAVSNVDSATDLCQTYLPEKVQLPSESQTVPIVNLADLLEQKKNRRKQKPEPLVIPPDVSNFDLTAPISAGSSRVTWDNNGSRIQASGHQDFMIPTSFVESNVVTCGMAGGSWIQRNVHRGLQPQSAPLYWPAQSYDSFDGRSIEARLPP